MMQIELLDGLPQQRLRLEQSQLERRAAPVLVSRHSGVQLCLWPNKLAEVQRVRVLGFPSSKRT